MLNPNLVSALEWIDNRTRPRRVIVKIVDTSIELDGVSGARLRSFTLKEGEQITIYYVSDEPTLVIQAKDKYDLVLKFETNYLRNQLESKIEEIVTKLNLKREKITKTPFKSINICSKKDRQAKLEMFFRVVFDQAFEMNKLSNKELLNMDSKQAKEIVHFQLTLEEFAESLRMRPTDEFVRKLFSLTDHDKSGTINYREFVDLLIIFAKGDERKKANLLFKMYDIDNTGQLSKPDLTAMIK